VNRPPAGEVHDAYHPHDGFLNARVSCKVILP